MMNIFKTRALAEKIWPKGFPLQDRKNFDSVYLPANSNLKTIGIRVTFRKNCPDMDALGPGVGNRDRVPGVPWSGSRKSENAGPLLRTTF